MKKILMITSLFSGLTLLIGCSGENHGGETTGSSPDHAAEAEMMINTENMDRHLEALEAEIAGDEAAIEN